VRFALDLSREAEKELEKVDRATLKRLQTRIEEVLEDPFSTRFSKSMTTVAGARISRVGNWRILFEVDEEKDLVKILAIRPRSKAYRK